MPKQTFDFVPDLSNTTKKVNFDVRIIQFGDGYEQRQRKSLRPSLRTWDLQKTAKEDVIDAIEAFFDARAGVESFYWTPPGKSAQVLVRTNGQHQRKELGAGLSQLNWQFAEVLA